MSKKILLLVIGCLMLVAATALFLLLQTKQQVQTLQTQLQARQNTLETTIEAYTDCTTKQTLCPSAPISETANDRPKSEIEKLLDPEVESTDRGSKIDQLKKRYEEVLVSYFVLRKCEKVNPVDYHIITSALSQEMASINAPGRLQYDILISAKGSYDALYASNSCADPAVAALQSQYQPFIDSVTEQFNLR